MKSKKTQFIILWSVALFYLFILSDVFFSPDKVDIETCTRIYTVQSSTGRYKRTNYYLHTNNHKYSINSKIYWSVSTGQNIFIRRSAITGANRYIEVLNGAKIIKHNVQFMSEAGLVALIFFTSITFLFMIFYEKIWYVQGRLNLTIFLTIISIIVFILHLRGALESF